MGDFEDAGLLLTPGAGSLLAAMVAKHQHGNSKPMSERFSASERFGHDDDK